MTHHDHGHKHDHHKHGHQPSQKSGGVHRQWWFWAAIVLMLAGIVAYVLSLDESLRPWGGAQQPAPADVGE